MKEGCTMYNVHCTVVRSVLINDGENDFFLVGGRSLYLPVLTRRLRPPCG